MVGRLSKVLPESNNGIECVKTVFLQNFNLLEHFFFPVEAKEKMEALGDYYEMLESWRINDAYYGQYKVLKKRDSIASNASFKALQLD